MIYSIRAAEFIHQILEEFVLHAAQMRDVAAFGHVVNHKQDGTFVFGIGNTCEVCCTVVGFV